MRGSCHCGKITVTVSHAPEYVNLCDCSLCAKSGGAWGYFTEADVQTSGATSSYRRADYPNPAVELQFCATCGTTTYWVLTEHFDDDKVGVNMRIFEPSEVAGIEARTLDGRNWFGKTDPLHRRPPGKLGRDVFL